MVFWYREPNWDWFQKGLWIRLGSAIRGSTPLASSVCYTVLLNQIRTKSSTSTQYRWRLNRCPGGFSPRCRQSSGQQRRLFHWWSSISYHYSRRRWQPIPGDIWRDIKYAEIIIMMLNFVMHNYSCIIHRIIIGANEDGFEDSAPATIHVKVDAIFDSVRNSSWRFAQRITRFS